MGKCMPKEKKKPEITTTASEVKWTADKKQVREVKLAAEKPEKKKEK
jgi:hypothetical protein